MNITAGTSTVITVQDVYRSSVEIPNEYSYDGFRFPLIDEYYISTEVKQGINKYYGNCRLTSPRIIVKKRTITPGMKVYTLYTAIFIYSPDASWDRISDEERKDWERFAEKLKETLCH